MSSLNSLELRSAVADVAGQTVTDSSSSSPEVASRHAGTVRGQLHGLRKIWRGGIGGHFLFSKEQCVHIGVLSESNSSI